MHSRPAQKLDMWLLTTLETVPTHVVLPYQRNALRPDKIFLYPMCQYYPVLYSCIATFDVLRKPRKNRFTTYHQFVLGISVYDMISSIAYTLVAIMAPYRAGFHLSRGNDATCTLQGFMIQLGQSSMFYNICLAFYFLLVIVYNWKERMFRRICLASHLLVFVFGAGLAFGAIPFVGAQFGVCGVLPPLTTSQWQASLFYTGPVSATLVLLTVVTAMICHKVYQQQKKGGCQTIRSLCRVECFGRALFFYVTLPPVLLTFYIEFETPQHYWLLVLAATLAPLQGFINTMVYFRRSRRKNAARSLFQCVRRRWTRKGVGVPAPTKTLGWVAMSQMNPSRNRLSWRLLLVNLAQLLQHRMGMTLLSTTGPLKISTTAPSVIGPQFGVCGVLPPLTTSQWQVSLFYAGPVSFTLVVLAVATAVICYKVYQQQKKAKKWMANVSAKLSRRVFWQSFWYVMAFYMTLAPMLFTFYIEFESPQHYWLLVLAATLAPLQGFINFLVYFQRSRRKLFNSLCSPCKGRTNKATSKKRPAVPGPRTKPNKVEIRKPECDDESDLKKTPVLSVQDNVATETTTENKLERSESDRNNNALESDTRTTSLANGSESSERITGVALHWFLNETWDTTMLSSLSHTIHEDHEELIDDGDFESVELATE